PSPFCTGGGKPETGRADASSKLGATVLTGGECSTGARRFGPASPAHWDKDMETPSTAIDQPTFRTAVAIVRWNLESVKSEEFEAQRQKDLLHQSNCIIN
ncbi:MAG: hypothetical protein OQJ87_11250, partial [Rhodospirillales bacterium]|nr:hypothetical protein [Rhodospirillales bacterium]